MEPERCSAIHKQLCILSMHAQLPLAELEIDISPPLHHLCAIYRKVNQEMVVNFLAVQCGGGMQVIGMAE